MSYTKEQIDQLHNYGKIPDWVYYQINGDEAIDNYRKQKKELINRFQQKDKLEKIMTDNINSVIEDLINTLNQ